MARLFRGIRLFGSRFVTQISCRNLNSVEIYPQVKENIRLLIDSDPKTAFGKLDEIGFTHLNNIKQFELEAADDKTKKLADGDKFPINENQVRLYHAIFIINF
jgi:hypothetical protein